MSRLAGRWGLGARHPGLYVTSVSPAVCSPRPLSAVPVPTAPARQVPSSIPCPSSPGCTTSILHGPSEVDFFYPNWPSLGGCWDFEMDLVAPSFRTFTPSKPPLFLPYSFSLLSFLRLPLSCPSCLNRLKPTLCSGFLWSW